MGIFDQYFVSLRLSAIGYSDTQIADLFGELSGTAQTLINFPQVFSTAVAMSLVPVITEAFTKRQNKRLDLTANAGVKLSMIIGLPCSIGFFILAQPIIAMLYPSIGEAKHITSGGLLQILSIGLIFLTLVQAFTAVLQSVNKQFNPVKNLAVGLVVKIILSFILIGIPSLNIKGATISSLGAYFVVALLNWYDINTQTPIKIKLVKVIARPLMSTAIMGVVTLFSFRFFKNMLSSQNLATLGSIGISGIVYVICLFLTGSITQDDLSLIPKGDKLKKFVRK